MKKLMFMSAAAMLALSAPAFATEDGPKHHKGDKMFEMHDTNADGVISKAEYMAHAEERFAKMDADGNGEVSKAEGEAVREKWKEKMKDFREKRKEARGERSE